ncbi:GM19406 [Drosophila sechellia]|uniref:GM19406 n=1 Tax=Drosophila sechellia TaxID=7238 RepID=B4HFS0_DROSE|nr:GM19406 [Drosophila sechellia]
MPCQDINVGGSGVLFELNKCQRRGETASKLTLHGAPIKLPMPPPPPRHRFSDVVVQVLHVLPVRRSQNSKY